MKPMLQQPCATGDLIDELAATRQAFGYTGLAGSTPPLATGMQPTASTSHQPDDLLPRQLAPKTVQYQPPSFKLTRLVTCLTMNKRIQNKRTHRTNAPTSHQGPDMCAKLANPETNRKGMKISHSFQAITISVCSVQEIIRP